MEKLLEMITASEAAKRQNQIAAADSSAATADDDDDESMEGDRRELTTIMVKPLTRFFATIRGRLGDRNRTGITPFRIFSEGGKAYENIAEVDIDPKAIIFNLNKNQFDQCLPRNAFEDKAYDMAEAESLAE